MVVSGAFLYAVATLLFASTTRPAWFIVFRLLEGIGAAAITPAGQALVADRWCLGAGWGVCRGLSRPPCR